MLKSQKIRDEDAANGKDSFNRLEKFKFELKFANFMKKGGFYLRALEMLQEL